MIASLAEIKSILQISDTSKDDFINAQIQNYTETILDYCNQRFIVKSKVYEFHSDLSIDVDNSKIISESGNFGQYLKQGMSIYVNGSRFNDGNYTIKTLSSSELVIEDIEEFTYDEDYKDLISIFIVKYPKALKKPLAYMINEAIEIDNMQGVKSESLDDYSVVYADVKANTSSFGFSTKVTDILKQYKVNRVW